jgi:hypothetical protein
MATNKIQIRNSAADFLVFTKQNGEDGIVETWRATSLPTARLNGENYK